MATDKALRVVYDKEEKSIFSICVSNDDAIVNY